MFNQTFLELLEKILEWDLNFLCPWVEASGKVKPSKISRACFFSPLILVLIMLSYVYYERESLSLITTAENLAMAPRSFGYAALVRKFYCGYKKYIENLLNDRKCQPSETSEKSMTERYCKVELILLVAYHVNCFCCCSIFFHGFAYFFPNSYQLPFNCYIIFLHPDEFLFAWELNYLVMTLTTTLCAFSIAAFLPIPLLIMNQSHWMIDMALMTTENLNNALKDETLNGAGRTNKINESLKKIALRCEKFVEWQTEVQDLLSWFFNLEFQVQSLILCLTIYVLTFASGLVLVVLIFCAIQIFVLCWMGTRVASRIEKLSFEISKNWYLMSLPQRKVAQMILHWTQNMKTFSGWFNEVNLETCKLTFEASYTFYTFLRSMNA